ncbi:hypothetical protein NQX30_03815 [Candidatus Persebacteraceae bacterium Df01]|jgi:hypothetical protein|uniref:PPM-type phosphatase domain-containing protein n=1 Tax=Candidatus Doriopsillibacter californiensis TaxID=2970740 RepID=A0ABT7QLC6_9GAMM|nr:hypothetical protein [Candidatus Persebacteraceae bacterium Df01]
MDDQCTYSQARGFVRCPTAVAEITALLSINAEQSGDTTWAWRDVVILWILGNEYLIITTDGFAN